jgi:YidC/Oxa1 family membrane protein insertase
VLDRNAFLAFALSFLVLSAYMFYEAKHHPPRPPAPAAEQVAPAENAELAAPKPGAALAAPAPTAPSARKTAAAAPPAEAEPSVPTEELPFASSLADGVLSSRGAGITSWKLREYQTPPSEGAAPVELADEAPGDPPLLATPLTGLGAGDFSTAGFQVVKRGPEEFVFEAHRAGVVVRKRFAFTPDSYRFRLQLTVENHDDHPITPDFGVMIRERSRTISDFHDLGLVALADGSVHRTLVARFGKPSMIGSLFGRGAPELAENFAGNVEWAGMDTHYFLLAMIPDVSRDAQGHWTAIVPGEAADVVLARPATLPPGTSVMREYDVYLGPKEPERLAAAGAQLDRSIQLGYSWIAPVTRAFTWLLKACYRVIPNYGVAIIVLTVLVRLATAPLAQKQMRSMKRLSEVQPRMKEIQEKYKSDRERQSQEMAKLMRETGWNPLGGCLPMFLQIPVFIGLYYALQSSIDLRQAPFMLWIDDLSRPETLFTLPGFGIPVHLLPILMIISMVVQQKLTPTTTMDPAQQRMMMFMMPLMFGFLFYTLPSGLVLYWFVSNVLAIAQQLWLNRTMAQAPA